MQLGDMGVSKIVKNAVAAQNTRVGTPLYLAPELIKQKPYDYKIDVWALGCIVYQLCTGKSPFSGENLISLGYNIVHTQQPSIPAAYSKELQELINLLMEKNPTKRLSSEEALAYIQNHRKGNRQSQPNLLTKPPTYQTSKGHGTITKTDSQVELIPTPKLQPMTTPTSSGVKQIPSGLKAMLDSGPETQSPEERGGQGLVPKPPHTNPTEGNNSNKKALGSQPSQLSLIRGHPEPALVNDYVGIGKAAPADRGGLIAIEAKVNRKKQNLQGSQLGGQGNDNPEQLAHESPYQGNSKLASNESLPKVARTGGSPGPQESGIRESKAFQSKREEGSSNLKIGNYLSNPRREVNEALVAGQPDKVNEAKTVPATATPIQRPATAGVMRGRPGSRYSNKEAAPATTANGEDLQIHAARNRFAPVGSKAGSDKMKAMEIMLKRATVDDPVCAILKLNGGMRSLEGRNSSPVGHRKVTHLGDNSQHQIVRLGSPSGPERVRSGYLAPSETATYRNQSSRGTNGTTSPQKPATSHKNDLNIDEIPSDPFPSATMMSAAVAPVSIKPVASHPFLDPYRAVFSAVSNQDKQTDKPDEQSVKDSDEKRKAEMFVKKQRPQTASANFQAGNAKAQGRYNSAAMMKVVPGGYLTRGSINMSTGVGLSTQPVINPSQSINYRIKSSTPNSNPTTAGSRPATAGGISFGPPFLSTDSVSQQLRFKKITVHDI